MLGTAAVASVSAGEVADPREDALQKLVASGLPAILEVGAAVKSAQAWEVEAGLLYDEYAWFLSDELWDIASTTRATQTPAERATRSASCSIRSSTRRCPTASGRPSSSTSSGRCWRRGSSRCCWVTNPLPRGP